MTTSKLVHDDISRDLSAAMRRIAEMTDQKIVIGAVFGLALRGSGRRYHVNVAGSLARDPTFARGVVAALDDELRDMVRDSAEAATTMRGPI